MQNFKIKFAIFVWILSFVNGHTQDVAATLNMARQHFAQNELKQSLDAYTRIDFFSDNQLSEIDYANLANIYLKNENYEKALFYFSAAKNSTNDSLKQFIYSFNKVEILSKIKKNEEAIIELFGLPEPTDSTNKKYMNLFYAINYFELDQLSEAKENFKKASQVICFPKIDSIFSSEIKLKQKIRPNKIRNLNWTLPGLGSAVMGDWKNAINASILTTGLGILTVVTIYRFGLFDGIIGVVPWFQRYYLGGADKSVIIAKQKIANNHYKTLSKLIEIAN